MTSESAMTFGDAITAPCGLRYMYDDLELQSGASRRRMLASAMLTDAASISKEYAKLEAFANAFANDARAADALRSRLADLKDIGGTIGRLSAGSVLDDIELFEIKGLSLLARDVESILRRAGISNPAVPQLDAVTEILDPDCQRIPTFYIYDSYSPELASIRKSITQHGDETGELLAQAALIEDEVRGRLSAELKGYAKHLREAVTALCQTDILLAKALQAVRMKLVIPEVSDTGVTEYEGLWHPETAARLDRQGKRFQSVNLSFANHPTIIVGANMGGKTITLKSVGLAQYLFQFGFGIPAARAVIDTKDDIKVCIGEKERSEEGLSAFATEIKGIDAILAAARRGSRDLALIDEPARTTNPQEGTALVKSLVRQMEGLQAALLLTTHYDLGPVEAHRLRVRGIVDGKMDYALLEADNGAVPQEAITIAHALGADAQWIEYARKLIDRDTDTPDIGDESAVG